jgi:hypothetical protein
MKVLRKMVLSLTALTCVSGVARAAPIVVYDKPVDEFQRVGAAFDADAKLGRVWIAIEKVDSEFETTRDDSVKARVDGLSYDQASDAVVYQAAGEAPIVCAKKDTELTEKRYNPTGNCPLKISYENRTIDDGTEPRQATFAKVTLNPTAGSAQR